MQRHVRVCVPCLARRLQTSRFVTSRAVGAAAGVPAAIEEEEDEGGLGFFFGLMPRYCLGWMGEECVKKSGGWWRKENKGADPRHHKPTNEPTTTYAQSGRHHTLNTCAQAWHDAVTHRIILTSAALGCVVRYSPW